MRTEFCVAKRQRADILAFVAGIIFVLFLIRFSFSLMQFAALLCSLSLLAFAIPFLRDPAKAVALAKRCNLVTRFPPIETRFICGLLCIAVALTCTCWSLTHLLEWRIHLLSFCLIFLCGLTLETQLPVGTNEDYEDETASPTLTGITCEGPVPLHGASVVTGALNT
eukprot:TRINITY_DN15457_c0_g1_i1.p1 TRINITY_DN15457_c0_g1~~TRINITY_DN15457_c0_g1_i1.p1  ORF type:complete len:179 (-),score=14.10 TRINITY_DN15457_c0_g1_i1:66-566(-)